jgi:hypothetical protein
VQITAADVGGDHFQDRTMRSPFSVGHDQLWVLQGIDPHVPGIVKDDCAITFRHDVNLPVAQWSAGLTVSPALVAN